MHLHLRNFQVINIVGACSLNATLDCEAFADAHRATSHFDQTSFVGLAWRPQGERCCCEIYSTGRANLPGAKTERHLLASFYRMLPELLRFSSSARLLESIPEEVRSVHRDAGQSFSADGAVPAGRGAAATAATAAIAVAEDNVDDVDDDDAMRLAEALGL